MLKLLINSFRSIKKRILQYLGLLILLTLSLSIFGGLIIHNQQLIDKSYILQKNPHRSTHYLSDWHWTNFKLLDDTKENSENNGKNLNILKDNNVSLIENLEYLEKQYPITSENDENWCEIIQKDNKAQIDNLLCDIFKIFSFQNSKNDKYHSSIKVWRILKTINDEKEKNNYKEKNNVNFQIQGSLISEGYYTNPKNHVFKILSQYNVKNSNSEKLINTDDVILVEGQKPENRTEIVISEAYAKAQKIKINDFLPIKNNFFKIVGIGNDFESKLLLHNNNDLGNFSLRPLNPQINGVIYTTTDFLLTENLNFFDQHLIKYKFQGNSTEFYNFGKYIFEKLYPKILVEKISDMNSFYMVFDKKTSSIFSTNFEIQKIVYISITIISIFGLILIAVFFIQKEITLQRNQVGNLKALGYSSWKISFNFIGIIFILSIFASILGFAFSFLFQKKFAYAPMSVFNIGISYFYYDWTISIIFFILLPLLFTFICYILILFLLKTPVLQLIYSKNKSKSFLLIYYIKSIFKFAPFSLRLSISFFSRSFGKWLISSVILSIVSFLLSFQYLINDTLNNKNNNYGTEWKNISSIKNQYQYQYQADIDHYDFDDFKYDSKNKPNIKFKYGKYFYNQQYEYIDINDIGEKNEISKLYQLIEIDDFSKIKEMPDNKKHTIYNIFNSKITDIICAIFKEKKTLKEIKEIFFNSSNEIILNLWKQLNFLPDLLKEKYKFNVSREITEIFIENREIFFQLFKEMKKNEFDKFKAILDTFYNFKIINKHDEYKTELTFNYIAYDSKKDFLLNSYEYKSEFLSDISKKNPLIFWKTPVIYGVEKEAYNNVTNWKNKEKYAKKILIDNNDEDIIEVTKKGIIPVLVSNLFYEHNLGYKINDIFTIESNELGKLKFKVAGILKDYISEYAIITNQKFLNYNLKIRECYNKKLYELNEEKNEWNKVKVNKKIEEKVTCEGFTGKDENFNPNFYSYKKFNLIINTKEPIPLFNSLSLYYGQSTKSLPDESTTLMNYWNLLKKQEPEPQKDPDPKTKEERKELEEKNIKKNKNDFPLDLTLKPNSIIIRNLLIENLSSLISDLQDSLIILRYTTLLVLGTVLILLVCMIIDDNLHITITMKILGYKPREIISLIIGWYLLSFIMFFIFGLGFSYLAWKIINKFLFYKTAMWYPTYLSLNSIILIISFILILLIIATFISNFIIKRKDLLLLQKQSN